MYTGSVGYAPHAEGKKAVSFLPRWVHEFQGVVKVSIIILKLDSAMTETFLDKQVTYLPSNSTISL